MRIATADRIDVREGLIHGFAYTIVLPFVLALLASMGLMWWAVTQGLRPLEALRRELARRPPGDDSPVAQGLQTRELAPLVGTLNQLLHRVRAAIDRERRWSDDAAHELRTPLTAIKTHVQVAQMALAAPGMPAGLLAAPPGSMARDSLAQAGEGVEHLQHTLEQLLLLARLEQHEPGAASVLACGDAPADALQALDKAWQLAVNAVSAQAPAPALRTWLDNGQPVQDWPLAISEPCWSRPCAICWKTPCAMRRSIPWNWPCAPLAPCRARRSSRAQAMWSSPWPTTARGSAPRNAKRPRAASGASVPRSMAAAWDCPSCSASLNAQAAACCCSRAACGGPRKARPAAWSRACTCRWRTARARRPRTLAH